MRKVCRALGQIRGFVLRVENIRRVEGGWEVVEGGLRVEVSLEV